ncbi:hypothetical protein Rs2_44470 [Raphanus sativus]|nr:hypothetical protein Rs2_44470 [Raphanus sativus]
MEAFGKSSANVIYLSAILDPREGPDTCHKCDYKCENENVCGNVYRCKLTGLTHGNGRGEGNEVTVDELAVDGRMFPLSSAEEQAVRGVRRKLDDEPSESCVKRHRRRDAQFHASPFERSFAAVSPICSRAGDGMEMN